MGIFLDSYDLKTPLIGQYYVVAEDTDEEGYEWRGFCEESWNKIKDMTLDEIYLNYAPSELGY